MMAVVREADLRGVPSLPMIGRTSSTESVSLATGDPEGTTSTLAAPTGTNPSTSAILRMRMGYHEGRTYGLR